MLISECMTKKVELSHPNMTLFDAAKKMRDGDFGLLPVSDGGLLVGVVTDRDIVVRAIAEGKDPKTCKVQEVLTKKVLYCYEDQTIEEIATNMGDNKVRRLPVLNRQKRLVGIVSIGDMAVKDPEQVSEPLSRISEHARRHGRRPSYQTSQSQARN
jgi:CBS domain-containing protein